MFPFQGGTYHGYGIHDFLHVDSRFARDPTNADDELRALVDAAHNLDSTSSLISSLTTPVMCLPMSATRVKATASIRKAFLLAVLSEPQRLAGFQVADHGDELH